ncbi:dihydrodipicolinate synthase family protein [Natronorubrum daqingense]|uniref:4-hydroxy-tetrahydrodipicolinate synthase n=1 Tax=Natronorubrum daqingense TaxID=588898 RepID=A0A1N7CKT7_9EURY|nr:dihydrodipicolinate synthase family protein [Natronorubrum daqingense]APX96949.1 dihydrodipicolinate synthase family protein [Natronorubrum daqingense]SIR64212.1 4-hydroxy-tetrahydrodipicolinate synthase [Natronorubrum daqingense]
MTLTEALSGITCPVVTPFEDTAGANEVDEAAFDDLIEYLLEGGIDGIFPCGTTGEFASLTPAERKRVHERTVEVVDGAVPVLAGAAATSVDEAVDYAAHAADIGADAAVVTEPYFHGANDPAGNQRFFEAVADRSPLPLLLYNIPPCTGDSIPIETIRALADHENVLGIKDSSGDLEYFCSVMRQTPEDFLALQGYDALLVPALRMGADGGLNALSNVAPAQYSELYETAVDPRGAEIQDAIVPLFDACADYGFAPATKTALEHAGVIPTDAVRPPLVEVPADSRGTIEVAVDDLLDG